MQAPDATTDPAHAQSTDHDVSTPEGIQFGADSPSEIIRFDTHGTQGVCERPDG